MAQQQQQQQQQPSHIMAERISEIVEGETKTAAVGLNPNRRKWRKKEKWWMDSLRTSLCFFHGQITKESNRFCFVLAVVVVVSVRLVAFMLLLAMATV